MSLLKRVAMCIVLVGTAMGALGESRRREIIRLVVQIQRADYEGDRPALKRLYNDLAPLVDDKKLGARVRYWRGFAMWRRALNGFNDNTNPSEIEQDLKQAASEFEVAIANDPAFVDARASAGATRGLLMALYSRFPKLAPEFKDAARKRESTNKALSYINEAEAAEPENPRVLWVLGPVRWYLSQQGGASPDKATDEAIEMYQKGLKAARAQRSANRDPLIPSWGEPECLMSLAASNFYRTKPDLAAAEQYARAALALVPYWHYVSDILIPQIEAAKAKHQVAGCKDAAGRGGPCMERSIVRTNKSIRGEPVL